MMGSSPVSWLEVVYHIRRREACVCLVQEVILMAFVGQTLTQRPHPVQGSASTAGRPWASMAMALQVQLTWQLMQITPFHAIQAA
jgi:hypothetical protein